MTSEPDSLASAHSSLSSLLVFRGEVITEPVYCVPEIPHYQGNPLIEALPPVWTQDEVAELLIYEPEYDEKHRQFPPHLRLHLMQNALQFFAPPASSLRLGTEIFSHDSSGLPSS
jgi:hypothetical protein